MRPAMGLKKFTLIVRLYPPEVKAPAPLIAGEVISAQVEPPSVDTSRTVPSNPDSRLNAFLNDSVAVVETMLIEGDTRRLSVTQVGSLLKAAFGALDGLVVVVVQLLPCVQLVPFENDVAQPEGNAGATTPSKFCEKVTESGLASSPPLDCC